MSADNAYGKKPDDKKKKAKDVKKVPIGSGLAAGAKKFLIGRDKSVMDQVDGKFAIK